MANVNTKIEWTDATWNPVTGCSKVSLGCKNCYAERLFARPYPGRVFTDVQTHPERVDAPLHWRKPRRVFVNSMSDLFHEAVPDEFIDRVFAVEALCPQHTFEILSKRPERMRTYVEGLPDRAARAKALLVIDIRNFTQALGVLRSDYYGARRWPLPNVWLGVSVEDQATANERIPLLLDTPAAVRWISAEPLLGPVDLTRYLQIGTSVNGRTRSDIQWVVVGGESGPGARICDVDWIRSIIRQCKVASVSVFCKQVGSVLARELGSEDRKGGRIEDWPQDIRIREFPHAVCQS